MDATDRRHVLCRRDTLAVPASGRQVFSARYFVSGNRNTLRKQRGAERVVADDVRRLHLPLTPSILGCPACVYCPLVQGRLISIPPGFRPASPDVCFAAGPAWRPRCLTGERAMPGMDDRRYELTVKWPRHPPIYQAGQHDRGAGHVEHHLSGRGAATPARCA